jgi:hypothetical protein
MTKLVDAFLQHLVPNAAENTLFYFIFIRLFYLQFGVADRRKLFPILNSCSEFQNPVSWLSGYADLRAVIFQRVSGDSSIMRRFV